MKNITQNLIIFFTLISSNDILLAQPLPYVQHLVDSLENSMINAKADTSKIKSILYLVSMYIEKAKGEKVIYYSKMADSISRSLNYPQGRIASLSQLAFWYARSQEWPKSINIINEAIPICKQYNPSALITMANFMFINYGTKKDVEKAFYWAKAAESNPYFSALPEMAKWPTYMQLGLAYNWRNQLDSAQYYAEILKVFLTKYDHADLKNNTLTLFGDIARKKKDYPAALIHYLNAHDYFDAAKVYDDLNNADSALYYAKLAYATNDPRYLESTKLLSKYYAQSNPLLSNKYLQQYADMKDTLFNSNKLKQLEEIQLNDQRNALEVQAKQVAIKNRIRQYALLALVILFFTSALLFFRNNQTKQKANIKLKQAYSDLKSTQAQLIQAEKMASLGELTAGIAHEIQNPLNFVNNFSDLNREMLEEMKEELANSSQQLETGNMQEAKNKLEDAMLIATDLIDNESKINHHGKRAESIVKGMLEHSRKSSGVKEPTNINKLCEEFVRLSYHGLRAKDKTFNCDYKLDLDPDLPLVKVVSQDIGRVILNIVNNSFQATAERFKSGGDLKSPPDLAIPYQPLIILTTKNLKDKIEISITDNGSGIPDNIKDKIFQPFFTTKPTGQGTGLGLSLAYDIVKAHGGSIRVISDYNGDGLSSGENTHTGTEFIIQLPI